MKNGPLFFFGLFASLTFSFAGGVLFSNYQLGGLAHRHEVALHVRVRHRQRPAARQLALEDVAGAERVREGPGWRRSQAVIAPPSRSG
jgi:hypothetical protein